MRRPRRLLPATLALLTGLLGLACGSDPMQPPSNGGILFIGNSLTGENDLAGIVAALYATDGDPIEVKAVVRGGASLQDQWADAGADGARAQIARGGWSVVVLQQGPSGLPESRENLVEWTSIYDERIRAIGARTALFSVWPMSDRMTAFDSVALSYSAAAAQVDGIYLPVTHAWLETWELDASAPLYSADGFHPSVAGSYLAAVTIYGVLTGRSVQPLPASIRTAGGYQIDVAPELANVLKTAATTAIAEHALR